MSFRLSPEKLVGKGVAAVKGERSAKRHVASFRLERLFIVPLP
ncbi:hypothetical protein FHT97_004191 [Rhizobium sp. BK399]|nr:hypothetical protein [Rhizobium sp. BK399]